MAHFARIERQHQANANALLKPYGIKHAEWRILALTHEFSSVSLTQIVELVVIERTTIGKLIDRMVERGWLAKGRSTADARTLEVSLTPVGQQLLSSTTPAMRNLMHNYSAAMSEGDFVRLMNMLRHYGQQVKVCSRPQDPDADH